MKTISMKLRTPLQDAEVAKLAMDLADRQVELDNDRELWAVQCRQHRDKTKDLNEIITELADKVHEKGYESDVECEVRPLEKSQRVQIIRLDTGEIVETRAMTEAEKQQEFKFEGVNDPSVESVVSDFFKNPDEQDATSDLPESGDDDNEVRQQMTADNLDIVMNGTPFDKKKVKETQIDFDADLEFGASIKVAEDKGTFFHFGFRVASKVRPKASYAVPVLEESHSFDDYNEMMRSAGRAMIQVVLGNDKFKPMSVDRANRIVATIEKFCEITDAVAAGV